MSTDQRYPIGKFSPAGAISDAERETCIRQIAEAPAHIRAAVKGFTEEQFNTPYRDGGWTVKQVVHHVPDSHMNAYIRFKLAMTENAPTIKPYVENLWAELQDSYKTPPQVSLNLLESLHERWLVLLRSMSAADFERTLNHPEQGIIRLHWMLQLYAWHGRHHTAHITSLRSRMGW